MPGSSLLDLFNCFLNESYLYDVEYDTTPRSPVRMPPLYLFADITADQEGLVG
jgi:hypothetical protein